MESRKYLRFEQAAMPYLNAWDEWIVSDYCFLNENEAIVVSSYLRLKSVRSVSNRINRSEQVVSKKIDSIYRKLLYGINVYRNWKKDRAEDDLYPLNVPISCLNAPVKLKHLLNQLGDTLAEILREYAAEDFLKLRGWGEGTISDLHSILDLYGYAYLLRPYNDFKQPVTKKPPDRISTGSTLRL